MLMEGSPFLQKYTFSKLPRNFARPAACRRNPTLLGYGMCDDILRVLSNGRFGPGMSPIKSLQIGPAAHKLKKFGKRRWSSLMHPSHPHPSHPYPSHPSSNPSNPTSLDDEEISLNLKMLRWSSSSNPSSPGGSSRSSPGGTPQQESPRYSEACPPESPQKTPKKGSRTSSKGGSRTESKKVDSRRSSVDGASKERKKSFTLLKFRKSSVPVILESASPVAILFSSSRPSCTLCGDGCSL